MTGQVDTTAIGTERSTRRADIQGLRAVAVVLVVVFHAGLPIPGGFIGVDVFFVISGFVITSMMTREYGESGRLSFSGFYARRVRRILPALAMTVGVIAIASLGAISVFMRPVTARTGVAASVVMANVFLYRSPHGYFDAAPSLNPLLNTWSLSVEEQFYLVFPILLVASLALGRKVLPRSHPHLVAGVIIGGLAVGSFLLCLYATSANVTVGGISIDSRFAFYMSATRAWEFAAGALLSLATVLLARLRRGPAIALGIVGALMVGTGAMAIGEGTPYPGVAALLPVIGTSLLIAAGTASRSGVTHLLGLRPCTRIGDISYSWYLWHWPLIVFAAALWPTQDSAKLIAAAISLPVAWASWRFVESPIRSNDAWRGRRALGLAGVCVLVPVVACIILLYAPDPPASGSTKALLNASSVSHADRVRGCNRGKSLGDQPVACTWTVAGSPGTIVLLGDSNAGHFTEPASRAANALGYDFSVGTFPTCPFIDLRVTGSAGRWDVCERFVADTMTSLLADPPAAVVLAASTPIYLRSAGVFFRDPVTGHVARSPRDKASLWTRGLTRTLDRLNAAGIPVVVIHTVPQWLEWDTRGCAAVRFYLSPRSCGTTQSRDSVTEFRTPALDAEQRAISEVPSSTGIDFIDQICSAKACATNIDDAWLYKDGRHLSVQGALGLEDDFVAILRERIDP
ncbi:MAG: acyltransferase [Acidimicrobiia bacterium]|nr:acyltransferase [Acidimicrobiia bacterium]